MQKIGFYFFYGFIWVITLLPLSILYLFSDFLYLIIFYLVRYRRSITRNNLKASFPDKSDKEIIQIEKKFYHHFCDSFIETMKQLHFSEKCLRKRIEINNKELFDDLYQKEKNIILYSGHYGNFEWVTILHKLLNSNTHYFFSPIYQKLKNTYFDILYITLRNKYGAISIEQKKAIRRILTLQKSNEKAIFLLVSDQRPRRNNLNYWITFMNQDTPVITGTEHIAKQTNSAAVYLEIQKISRGHYAWSFTLMEENPKILPNYKLTDMYFSLLEKTIRKAPQYYLWTHKRWLYKKENGN